MLLGLMTLYQFLRALLRMGTTIAIDSYTQQTRTREDTVQRLLRPQARLQCFIKDKDRSHVLGSSVGDKPDTDQKTVIIRWAMGPSEPQARLQEVTS